MCVVYLFVLLVVYVYPCVVGVYLIVIVIPLLREGFTDIYIKTHGSEARGQETAKRTPELKRTWLLP